MDNLETLNSLGFTLPSPAYILGSIIFGIIGWAAYRYGKKSSLSYVKWIGVALMLYPYAISNTWLLYLVGIGLSAALYVFRNE
jgi:hypothetical protein